MILDSELLQLEEERKKVFNKSKIIRIIAAICIGIALILIGVGAYLHLSMNFVGLILFVVGAIVLLVSSLIMSISSRSSSKFKGKFYNTLVKKYSNEIYNNLYFDSNSKLSEDILKTPHFFTRYDVYKGDNLFNASYNDVNFQSGNYDIKVRRSNGRHQTHYQTIGMGKFFVFNLKRNFKFSLMIVEKTAGPEYSGLSLDKKVEMESMEFNKRFKISTTDPMMAYYVISPRFMDKIMEFEKSFEGNLYLSLIDDKFYIAINNYKPKFRFNIKESLTNDVYMEYFLNEIRSPKTLIDLLDFDESKFNKEIKEY